MEPLSLMTIDPLARTESNETESEGDFEWGQRLRDSLRLRPSARFF